MTEFTDLLAGGVGRTDSPPYSLYPVTLTHLEKSLAVVVGGGVVGERKVRGLLAANVRVRLIAPAATPALSAWAENSQIEWMQREFQPGDLAEAGIVFAATNVRAVNQAVTDEALGRGLLVNVADVPAEGNFHAPAVHRTDEALIAISSYAGRPHIATRLRDRIAALLG
ncbi:MAG: bifunctional precorrin-2 dehydrogenase/sirohydrochlorin ferrochelatase [Chloroflexi bacterium]|nr:MAG: bifunctional precorrin-2 dehydrogenase/sirohydrochlorin ferrochelatase [Chloroflexota bacterium]